MEQAGSESIGAGASCNAEHVIDLGWHCIGS
jgi:hypothetical protein